MDEGRLEMDPGENRDAQPLVEALVVAEPDDPLSREVVAEVDRLLHPKASWAKTAGILVVSLALFVVLGIAVPAGTGVGPFKNPVLDLALLIGVLFFHELGHYLGMRMFGYRNVRMFFIPLFGAAVSGQEIGVEGYKKAIVTLLGPLPGLFLGLGLLVFSTVAPTLILSQLALLLVILNGFNLLPIFPLDGGRFLHEVLFSRNRYLESVVNVLAALALFGLGVVLDAWVFYLMAGFVLMAASSGFKTSTIAQQVQSLFPALPADANRPIPLPVAQAIIARVRTAFRSPTMENPSKLAPIVLRVWEKVNAQPPDLGATVGLLLLYAFSFAAMLIVPVVVFVIRRI